jgi:hypothetical protein
MAHKTIRPDVLVLRGRKVKNQLQPAPSQISHQPGHSKEDADIGYCHCGVQGCWHGPPPSRQAGARLGSAFRVRWTRKAVVAAVMGAMAIETTKLQVGSFVRMMVTVAENKIMSVHADPRASCPQALSRGCCRAPFRVLSKTTAAKTTNAPQISQPMGSTSGGPAKSISVGILSLGIATLGWQERLRPACTEDWRNSKSIPSTPRMWRH